MLNSVVTDQMVAAGWSVEPTAPPSCAWFRCAVNEEFSAIAAFDLSGRDESESRPVVASARVGVSYERAYRLWAVVQQHPVWLDLWVDIGVLLDPPQDWFELLLSKPSKVAEVASTLTDLVLRYGESFARAHSSLDALIAAIRSDGTSFAGIGQEIAILLAAAGRYDEAQVALDDYRAGEDKSVHTRKSREFAFRLQSWLNSEHSLPDPSSFDFRDEAAQPPGERAPHASDEERRKERTALREARHAVHGRSAGLSRDEQRELLVAEYRARGVSQTPLEVEQALDSLELVPDGDLSPLGKVRQARGILRSLGEIGSGIRALVRQERAQPPDWLVPPERASYGGPSWRDRSPAVAIELDAQAPVFLDRVFTALSPHDRVPATPEVWLDWDPDAATPESRIAAHIGQQRVGILQAAASDAYRSLMNTAAAHGELPSLNGRLGKVGGNPGFILELRLPE
jgi:hypothetical protein